MKTPYLIKVPKVGPSKHERLQEFKKKHRIHTHDCGPITIDHRWAAALLNESLREFGCYCHGEAKESMPNSELFMVLVGHTCRLMDEARFMETGTSEMEAIRNLCRENKIEFPF